MENLKVMLRKLYFKAFCLKKWHMRHYPIGTSLSWSYNSDDLDERDKVGFPTPSLLIESLLKRRSQKKNRSIFILASGPTLKSNSLDSIRDADVAFLNGSLKEISEVKAERLYHIVSDPNFIKNQYQTVLEKCHDQLIYVYSVRAFYELYKLDRNFVVRNIDKFSLFDQIKEPVGRMPYRKEDLTSYNSDKFFYDLKENIGISLRPEIGFFDGRTVLHLGLQISAFLDYKDIHLLGVDMNDGERFYHETKKAPSYIDLDFDSKILPSLKLFADFAKNSGIEVINHSPRSRVDEHVFSKRPFFKNL